MTMHFERSDRIAPLQGHRLLRTFADSSRLSFGPGRFDAWCVYLTRPGQQPDPPRDLTYFARLKALAARHGAQLLYTDFLALYHRTTADVAPAILELCYWLSRHYGDDALEVDIVLSILYAGMVAEDNKARARLKKRVKRLGMHQLLLEDFTAEAAASFSRGKTWQEIDMACTARGF